MTNTTPLFISETLVVTDMGGQCPVQAEGTLHGKPFYFRARGGHWSLSVGGTDPVSHPEWTHREAWGEGPFDAGWMTEEEAMACLHKGAQAYKDQNP